MHHEDIYEQKLKQSIGQKNPPSERRLWIDILIYSLIIFAVIFVYHFALADSFNRRLVNKSLADAGMILIGLSFGLSGFCYFWNVADHLIIYRKHLGLAGFGFAMAHTIWSLIVRPLSSYLTDDQILSFLNALLAIIIYSGMALISNRFAINELGGKLWKNLLRLGYIAYIFTIVHFTLRGYDEWLEWFVGKGGFMPPFSLIAMLFGVTILILRVAVWISLLNKKSIPSPYAGPKNT